MGKLINILATSFGRKACLEKLVENCQRSEKLSAIFLFLQYPGLRWSYIFVINLSSYKTKISFENVKLNYINETTRLEWYANTYD